MHAAARRGPQLTHRCRERIERVQRLAEAIERQRLHVIFEVGSRDRCIVGIDFANAPSCDGAIDIGPLRISAYCRPINSLPHQCADSVLSVAHAVHLVCHAQLQMILQIFADAAQVVHHGMPSRCRRAPLPMPDSSSSCGEFTAPAARITSLRACATVVGVAAAIFDADAPLAFEHEPLRVRAGDHREIGTLRSRPQERFRCVPAHAAAAG